MFLKSFKRALRDNKIFLTTVFMLFSLFYGKLLFASNYYLVQANRSGGWVFNHGNYRIPDPHHIRFRFIGNLGMTMGNLDLRDEEIRNLFQEAMNYWERVADIHFIETTTDHFNPVHIGRAVDLHAPPEQINDGYAGTVPPNMGHQFPYGAIILNNYFDNEQWEHLFRGVIRYLSLDNTPETRRRIIRRIIMHEIGHLLGMAHPEEEHGDPRNILPIRDLDRGLNTIMLPINDYIAHEGNRDLFFDPSTADRAALILMYGRAQFLDALVENNQARLTGLRYHIEL